MNTQKNFQNSTEASNDGNTVLAPVDYSKKENQIGCGYCKKEKSCKIRDQKINKAKQGCKEWDHWQDCNGY